MQIVIPVSVYPKAVNIPAGSLATLTAMAHGAKVPNLMREGEHGMVTIFADRLVAKGHREGNIIRISDVKAGRSA